MTFLSVFFFSKARYLPNVSMQLLYGLVLRLPTSVVDAVLGLTAPKTLPAALNK